MNEVSAVAAIDVRPAAPAGGNVTYVSKGRLLVIAGDEHCHALAGSLPESLSITCLLPPGIEGSFEAPSLTVVHGRPVRIDGYLGGFRVTVEVDGQVIDLGRRRHPRDGVFDLILDLASPPCLDRAVPPPGYFTPEPEKLDEVLETLPEYAGEFQKPRYFDYRTDICAHGGTETNGCDRCLQVCGAGAIHSRNRAIEVDPMLCQGCGVCATVCPSGAIRYDYPDMETLSAQLRRELAGLDPDAPATVVFHQEPLALESMEKGAAGGQWLLVRVEDVGSVGGDVWLATLCYGADRILCVYSETTPQQTRSALQEQTAIYNAILDGLGYGNDRLHAVDWQQAAGMLARTPAPLSLPRAGFAGFNEKRTMLELAISHMYQQSTKPVRYQALPAQAPFGNVNVDTEGCTLCMACVGVCPASALQSGGGEPVLKFIESNCVQCGACEEACPEDVIRLEPRMDYDRNAARQPRVVKEDEPVYCEDCGKAFGTRSMIRAIAAKLEDHWMYQTGPDRNLFRLCGDCRAKRMFSPGKAPGSRIKATMVDGGDRS